MDKQIFLNKVRKFLPWSQTHTEDMLAKAYSVDASPFEPRAFAVLGVYSLQELTNLLACAAECDISLTFRGSGTSLSGQSVAEDVAVRFKGDFWRTIEVLDNGQLVRAGCAVTGGAVNAALAPFGRFITSDPSSIASATIGGMAANNAAGLSCTVPDNIYHRVVDLQFLLADGTFVDTASSRSVDRFRYTHAAFLKEISRLREYILTSDERAEKIRRKYRIRNTCGYSLNAFVDYEDPVDIIKHLLIGSEGTLGFIFSITLETAPIKSERGTAIVVFSSLDEAMQAMLEMRKSCELYAGEFLDDVSLRSLAELPGFPAELRPSGECSDDCALLLETRAEHRAQLAHNIQAVQKVLLKYTLKTPLEFVTDPVRCEKLWDIRRALFPALAGTRLPSEYAYAEDYCVPIEHLPEASHEFVRILRSLGFNRSGVNGHALHGNLHCTVPLKLCDAEEVERFGSFMEQAASTVLRLNGSLKAEHGTGRAVAPFVRREWGDDLYHVMLQLKKLFDPQNILNRGCILNEDPHSHLDKLKFVDSVGQGIDLCVDCGFCEAVCPSAEKGFSPRQRIYALRAMAGMKAAGDTKRAAAWKAIFLKRGVDLCATDGLCSTRCPLGIDVASFVRGMRHDALNDGQKEAASWVRRHIRPTVKTASIMLDIASCAHGVLGHVLAEKTGAVTRTLTGMTLPDLRQVRLCGSHSVPIPVGRQREKIVYFPSCAVRSMGYSDDSGRKIDPLMDTALRLLEKAGYDVVIPFRVETLCCGKAFETKGMKEEADASAATLNEALLTASENGRWPVMCDTSPCLARMRKTLDHRLNLYEPVEFTLLYLADHLDFIQKRGTIAVHATCSTRAMGLVPQLIKVAGWCAQKVILPEGIYCCGFSGDKGFSHPELNASALETLADQIADCEEGFSTSRTCEVGLTLHGKRPYRNILYLIDECSRAKDGVQ